MEGIGGVVASFASPGRHPCVLASGSPERLAGGTEVGEEGSREQRRPSLSPSSPERGLE